nr:hypothetical protein [Tanacetum cinerariifolium]
FNDSLKGLYNIYYAKYGNPTIESSSGTSSSRASGGNQMSRLLNRLQEHTKKKQETILRCPPNMSDITRLTPASLEMCMYLKGHLDAQERKQHKSGLENPIDFEEEILDADVQQNEAILISEEEIKIDVASSEGTMSGLASGGEEGHLDAQERKQHKSGLENPIDFEEEILDADVQQNEVIPISEEEIKIDVASSEGTMSGLASVGEEVDYDMTNYGYDDYE